MSRRAGKTRTVLFPFHSIIQQATAGNVATLGLNALNAGVSSTRLQTACDVFDEYRVKRLRYCILNNLTDAGIGNSTSMAFYPGVTTTPPTTILQMGENPTVAIRPNAWTVPTGWVEVPAGDLAGEQPWYKVGQAVALADSTPGNIYIATTVAICSVLLEFDGVYEFRGEAAPANTPMAREKRHQADLSMARAKLQEIMLAPLTPTTKV